MLQINVAPNIGPELSSNQWPIILDAELHTTCRGERVFSSHQIQCNIPTF